MAKNILIFADGTGNSGQVDRPTNVYKLFQMTSNTEQVSYYREGVGLGTDLFGFMTGHGISENIKACYKFACENYHTGDQVFLFGFSRGAATVRSLSGLIDAIGYIASPTPELIEEAFSIYKTRNQNDRLKRAEEFQKRNHCVPGSIYFLGVWDTVVSLGLIYEFLNWFVDKTDRFQIKFHNFDLCASVKTARHAIAIDERRYFFSVKLWDSKIQPHQNMKQVWFPGTHTNVGGGWKDSQGLSDIALEWMIQEAVSEGLILQENHQIEIKPDPNGSIAPTLRLSCTRRKWNSSNQGKPVVHNSVPERQKKDPSYQPWILKEKCETQE